MSQETQAQLGCAISRGHTAGMKRDRYPGTLVTNALPVSKGRTEMEKVRSNSTICFEVGFRYPNFLCS